jgi:hypothetical protein
MGQGMNECNPNDRGTGLRRSPSFAHILKCPFGFYRSSTARRLAARPAPSTRTK